MDKFTTSYVEKLLFESFFLQKYGVFAHDYGREGNRQPQSSSLSSYKSHKTQTNLKVNSSEKKQTKPRRRKRNNASSKDSTLQVKNSKKNRNRKQDKIMTVSEWSDIEILDEITDYRPNNLGASRMSDRLNRNDTSTQPVNVISEKTGHDSRTSPEKPGECKKTWECPICLEYSTGQEIVATVCGHIFCKKCIEHHCKAAGVKAVCPTCRFELHNKTLMTLYNI